MMKIYDEVIQKELDFIWSSATPSTKAGVTAIPITTISTDPAGYNWPDDGNNAIIFRSDMAYELGGGTLSAISSQTLTEDEELVPENEILLYGPDLNQISKDISYARLTFLRVKKESFGEGNALYSAIRKIDYTKYHVHPHGYMSRISAANHREPVRVSKTALSEGLSFEKIGNAYMKAYLEHPQVEAVKIIFITDPAFDYKALESHCLRAEQITDALDHILKDFKMDCKACNLKEVCDEVEGLRELHFSAAGQ